ncbi:hypothetical protein EVJ50_06720 [Synechococcus sp. RSCCF101]|uniref:hypothetical protein n=1 Tax=Synechococcus sp. RSCCF101 TaxID=2511069 RepID=UPI0012479FE0|nr:hypothetical protein [Synechococcus sp. RSCCF101]QEY31973.1 hypothetical protein EVJ50_06720 [Synechococcus sp. RSCCF101]
MGFWQCFAWLNSSRSSPRDWQTTLQLCLHSLSEIVPALFIAFAIRLERDIVNPGAGIDTGNLKLLLLGSVAAITLMVVGAVTLRIVLNRLSQVEAEVFETLLVDYTASGAMAGAGMSTIQSDLLEMEAAAELLGRDVYRFRGSVAAALVFFPLMFAVQGPIAVVGVVFAVLTVVAARNRDRSGQHRLIVARQLKALQLRAQSVDWICWFKPLLGLSKRASRDLSLWMDQVGLVQGKVSALKAERTRFLTSLAQLERVVVIVVAAIGIALNTVEPSQFILFVLLAGRFTKPVREASEVILNRHQAISALQANGEWKRFRPSQSEEPAPLVLPSSNVLIASDVLSNLTLGQSDLEPRAVDLLLQTRLWPWISRLPDGLNTPLAEDSDAVPSHLRQLIASLRALTHRSGGSVSLDNRDRSYAASTIEDLKALRSSDGQPVVRDVLV